MPRQVPSCDIAVRWRGWCKLMHGTRNLTGITPRRCGELAAFDAMTLDGRGTNWNERLYREMDCGSRELTRLPVAKPQSGCVRSLAVTRSERLRLSSHRSTSFAQLASHLMPGPKQTRLSVAGEVETQRT